MLSLTASRSLKTVLVSSGTLGLNSGLKPLWISLETKFSHSCKAVMFHVADHLAGSSSIGRDGLFDELDFGLRRNDGVAVDKRTFVLYDAVIVLHVDSHDLVRE